MFIKVHDKDREAVSYINTDKVNAITENNGETAIWFAGDNGSIYVKEPIDKLMKIIGYFTVASDK